MKIVLFDLWAGGHNHLYFRRFAEALPGHEVYAVAPDAVLARIVGVQLARVSGGGARPRGAGFWASGGVVGRIHPGGARADPRGLRAAQARPVRTHLR